jgi:trehalose 6-phosphate synthase
MSRLVIVSNRVALPGESAQRSGGLVTGLVDALHQAGGLWFGWSGKLGETAPEPNVFETDGVTYATVDLTRADHDGYYSGFSNAALWPLFHYRLDLMNFTRRDLAAYRRVNALLAGALAPLLRPSDLPPDPHGRGTSPRRGHTADRVLLAYAVSVFGCAGDPSPLRRPAEISVRL